MNRRAFLQSLVATAGIAVTPMIVEAALVASPAEAWKAYFEQWLLDAIDIHTKVWEDQIIWGIGAVRQIETYPFIERVDPTTLIAPPTRGGLFA